MRVKEFGARRSPRVDFQQPAFIILAPKGTPRRCRIVNISAGGACVDVGSLSVQKFFMLVLSSGGRVRRICRLVWRRGPLIGACFVSLKDIKEDGKPKKYVDPRFQKIQIQSFERRSSLM